LDRNSPSGRGAAPSRPEGPGAVTVSQRPGTGYVSARRGGTVSAWRCVPSALGAGGGAAALLRVQDDLADTHGLRGHLDALVLAAELQGLLQRELAGRDHVLRGVRGGRTHVGELLLLGDVHVHVVGAGVLADDHALVDLGA